MNCYYLCRYKGDGWFLVASMYAIIYFNIKQNMVSWKECRILFCNTFNVIDFKKALTKKGSKYLLAPPTNSALVEFFIL